MQTNAAGESASGQGSRGGGGVLQDKTTNVRLLQHANEVRKHANLDTLDAFLQQSGYSWIEMMISHAKDSFESYQTSTHEADSTMAHAFEHHMAAEMLKTPSPKKKRAPAFSRAALDTHSRPQSAPMVSSESPADDKENNQLPSSSSNAAPVPASPVVQRNKTESRNTRSRGDKSQLVQLPNPFQPRPQSKSQAKEKTANAGKQAKSKANSRSDDVRPSIDQGAAGSQSSPQASTRQQSATVAQAAISTPLPPVFALKAEQLADDDSREVECSLQVVAETPPVAPKQLAKKAAAPVLQSKLADVPEATKQAATSKIATDEAMQEAEELMLDSAGQCTTVEAEDDDDDDEEDEEAGSLTHSVKVGSALHSPSARESTPPPQSPEKAQRAETSRFARAKLEESLLNLVSDGEESVEEGDDDEVVLPLHSPSARESTPPLQSPTKAQRAEMSRFAREKLEESLLKLASDGEESAAEDNDDESALQSWARQEKRPSPRPAEQKMAKVEEQMVVDKDTSVEMLPSSDDAQPESDMTDKAKTQPAPKRTLSSMTHAKKSMVGSSSIVSKQQQAQVQRSREPSLVLGSAVMATSSAAPQTKSSFLSKSIMRVEQDQRSVEEELDGASLPAEMTAAVEEPTSKKRKSDEREDEEEQSSERTSKAAKREIVVKEAKGQAKGPKKVEKPEAAAAVVAAPPTATHPQPQSLREKIESYNTHKSGAQTSTAARNFSSMSTHSVGLGPSKITSPILPRSDSQKSLNSDMSPPQQTAKSFKSERPTSPTPSKSSLKEQGKAAASAKTTTKTVPVRPVQEQSTTPLNSPTKPASSFLAKAEEKKAASTAAAAPSSSSSSPVRNAKGTAARDSIDEASESDAGVYDTSSDGDLSLVDLMGGASVNLTTKHTATAPRPPGTGVRPVSALPKQQAAAAPAAASSSKASTFMPSSAKDGSRPASRLGQKGSTASTASSSSASSGATAASMTPSTHHATWGGSISSKLKGMLGFSSSTSGASPTAPTSTSPSKSKIAIGSNGKFSAASVSIPTRKESFIGGSANAGGAAASRPAPPSASAADKKSASVIRADAARKREGEQAERRAKEKDDRAKAAQEASRKRLRDEQLASASMLSATTTTSSKAKLSSVGPSAGKTLAHQASQQKMNASVASDAKKRKSNDGVAVPVAASAKSFAKQQPPTTSSYNKPSSSSSKPISSAQSSTKKPHAKPQPTATPANIFSDHNPFQRAQVQQQQQSLAAVSQQVHKHKPSSVAPMSKLSPASKAQAVANTAHIELEEPDSAYSDSDDEETIKRRKQHKPWETREGLALALEAQAGIDADMIFGIPQGAVPLDDILPAETEHARVRRMRPRSSSATWSRDGLKQFEIDRYNERMGIATSGVQLLLTRDDGSGTPSRPTANGRMSALAQSAIAQGASSSSKKPSGHAHR